jgi:hypothetical protein
LPRNALRNASISSAAFELALRLGALRSAAMAEGRDYIFLVVDAPGNDGMNCELLSPGSCASYFILANPTAAWALGAFNPDAPGTNAELVDTQRLPKGARFSTPATTPPPAPFSAVPIFDSQLLGTCAGRSCMATRFTSTGTVRAEFPVPSTAVRKVGMSFVLGSDLAPGAADRKGVVVGFPTGIVKTFPY